MPPTASHLAGNRDPGDGPGGGAHSRSAAPPCLSPPGWAGTLDPDAPRASPPPSRSPSDLARQRLEGTQKLSRPPQPAGFRDPTVPGDRGCGHPKACGLREEETPLPVNRLTFPSQWKLHPLPPAGPPPSSIPPCTAGSCGYLEGLSKIRVEKIRRERVGLRARPIRAELQFPAGNGASEGGCWRAGCRTPRAR